MGRRSKPDAISKAVIRRKFGDDKYRVYLEVGVQSFVVGDPSMFDMGDAIWYRTMLIRALRRLVAEAKKEDGHG